MGSAFWILAENFGGKRLPAQGPKSMVFGNEQILFPKVPMFGDVGKMVKSKKNVKPSIWGSIFILLI